MKAQVVYDLGTVLTITTGTLLTNIKNVYDILDYMTGERPYTHQIPRFMEEVSPCILEQYPQFSNIDVSHVNENNYKEVLDDLIRQYGNEFPLTPCNLFSHKVIDAQEELIDMLGGDESKVVIVTPDIVNNEDEMNRLKNHLRSKQ